MLEMNWEKLLNDCVEFTQRLIQTPSMTFEESEVAELIADEMRRLSFDEVWIDEIGNVNGRLWGRDRTLGTLVLNSHIDHVDPGDPSLWPVPPYSGDIVGDRIFGRGACDIKGPLAVQVYSMAGMIRAGQRPKRDVVFCGVVQEEVGGAGAVYWVENLDYDLALIMLGEPSSNDLSLGHRGILQMWVTFYGRSVHASVPDKGVNPNQALAKFLVKLESEKYRLKSSSLLGPTTVAPTIIEVDTKSMNVTPAWSRVLLDFRTATESPNSLLEFVDSIAGDSPYKIYDAWNPEPNKPMHSSDETIVGYYTDPNSDMVKQIQTLLAQGMGRQPALSNYEFATDGRHFASSGVPIIGYSPGEEHLAHTSEESISIGMMAEGIKGHLSLLQSF